MKLFFSYFLGISLMTTSLFSMNNENETLVCAVKLSDLRAIKLLLDKKNIDLKKTHGKDKKSILHYIKKSGETERTILTLLVKAGADIDQQDLYGNTPLHDAVGESNQLLVTLLMQQGASISILNNDCLSAWSFAKNDETFERLREAFVEQVEVKDRETIEKLFPEFKKLWQNTVQCPQN